MCTRPTHHYTAILYRHENNDRDMNTTIAHHACQPRQPIPVIVSLRGVAKPSLRRAGQTGHMPRGPHQNGPPHPMGLRYSPPPPEKMRLPSHISSINISCSGGPHSLKSGSEPKCKPISVMTSLHNTAKTT